MHSDASYNNNDSGAGEWKSNTLYLERGFGEIESTLRAGDMYTSGDIFDTVRFRGVRLYRDMQMLPNSRRNFTPIVQGLRKAMPWSPLSKMALSFIRKRCRPVPLPSLIYRWPAAGPILT
ncbi:fimbria/pilus outer membrane usher protein [Klebsiella variicola subsp. variicola]|nr:fimbria/pilus outer membrane usher protein [Klebsiella variicola subsp. variicola]